MEKNRRLIWDEQALIEVERSLEWIGKTSLHQTELVEQAILSRIELIRVHPERFPPDKYKINNQGSYRAFETHSYRISYIIRKTRSGYYDANTKAETKKILKKYRQKLSQIPSHMPQCLAHMTLYGLHGYIQFFGRFRIF